MLLRAWATWLSSEARHPTAPARCTPGRLRCTAVILGASTGQRAPGQIPKTRRRRRRSSLARPLTESARLGDGQQATGRSAGRATGSAQGRPVQRGVRKRQPADRGQGARHAIGKQPKFPRYGMLMAAPAADPVKGLPVTGQHAANHAFDLFWARRKQASRQADIIPFGDDATSTASGSAATAAMYTFSSAKKRSLITFLKNRAFIVTVRLSSRARNQTRRFYLFKMNI